MPDEHRLTLLGKHPAFGDFIAVDAPSALRDTLSGWSDAVFMSAKADWGGDWPALYDAAPILRFWIGEDVSGSSDAPFAGVLAFSRDKVGRRSPLILGWAVAGFSPPFAPDALYDVAAAGMAQLLDAIPAEARDLLPSLMLPVAKQVGPRSFWAASRDGSLPDIVAADHRAAAARRSYWWTAQSPSVMVAAEGLPDGAALSLLMQGVALPEDEA